MKKLIVLFIIMLFPLSANAGWRENAHWGFQTSEQNMIEIGRENLRQLKRGGYYDQDYSTTNNNKYIFSQQTNIANQNNVTQSGDGTVTTNQDMSDSQQQNQSLNNSTGDQDILNDGGYY